MPSIDRKRPAPFYLQVYEQIAQGIESGVYPAGRKLPSIRECARELGVSNTTVELAYRKLAEEGYVEARRGSGYTICALSEPAKHAGAIFDERYEADLRELLESAGTDERPKYDFSYDAADPATFPLTTWARICREVYFGAGAKAACLYNDRQGLHELREQVSHYASSEYGVRCTPEQVLVMPTTGNLIAEIASLFDPAATTVAMEDPGYDEAADAFERAGFAVKRLPVFPLPTFAESEPHLQGADIVFATASCQFPSNAPMPAELREELVGWAKRAGAYLIDDEYGWEFQSGSGRVPPLAAFDTAGRVITLGTFSNSFTPAVCLSFAILPPQLALQWRASRRDAHPLAPWQTQAAMAEFMREGHWRTHIRKVRTAMQKKRLELLRALDEHLGPSAEVVHAASSLFVLVQARDGRGEDELVNLAARAGVRVYPTSRYWRGPVPAQWRYVLVGYAGIDLDDIEDGVRALAQAWA